VKGEYAMAALNGFKMEDSFSPLVFCIAGL